MDRLNKHFLLLLCLLALNGPPSLLSASGVIDSLLHRIEQLTAQPDALSALALDWHRLGLAYDDEGDTPAAINATQQALTIRLQLEEQEPDPVLVSATNLGLYNQSLGQYEEAKRFYQLVLDRGPNRKVGQVRYQLAKLYDNLGETVLADQSFQLASSLPPFNNDAYNRYFLFLEWGNLYLEDNQDKANEALSLLSNALVLCDSLGDYADYYEVYTLNRVGLGLVYSDQLPAAIEVLRNAQSLNANCCQDEDLESTLVTNLGIAHRRLGQMDQALTYYQQSLAINEGLSEGAPDSYLANDHDNLSTFYLLNGDAAQAVEQAERALYFMLPAGEEWGTPAASDEQFDFSKLEEPRVFLNYLLDLGRAETAMSNQDGQAKMATATYASCDQLIDYLYESQSQQLSRLELRATARDVYTEAINLALSQDDIALAFYYSEKARSQILLDEQLQARAGAALPDDLARRLQQNRAAATFYAEQDADSEQFLEANQNYERLLDSLSQVFPTFATAQELQFEQNRGLDLEHVKFEQTIVEYFFADDFAWAFVIEAGKMRQYELDLQAINTALPNFKSNLLDYQLSFRSDQAIRLYELLIQPLELNSNQGLIIIPDGPIQGLPFAALLAEEVDESQPYKNWPWLQKEQVISYAFSLRWLLEQQGKKPVGDFLFFGPMSNLQPEYGVGAEEQLVLTERFISDLKRQLQPLVLLGPEAGRSNFNREIETASSIHLSTHAFPSSPEQPSAYFLLADQQDNRYFTHELFKHRMQADLVVLAACETNLGVVNRGEGVASLGRSFAYAGARSLVSSLWPVDESATNNLLLPFYEELKKGSNKAQALQAAQANYINNQLNNDLAHPYFWAGLIYQGKHQESSLSRKGSWSYWYLLFLALPLVYLFIWKRAPNLESG